MVVLGFRFPAGRYHATPWGRHVNEADVEWPPSPWRILRALVATWHRKLDPELWPEAVLEALVDHLSEAQPSYRLPAAVRAHTRHYMPRRSGKAEKSTLVFDGFASVARDEELVVVWPVPELPPTEGALLDELVTNLAFLGRAESWVEARRLVASAGDPDCVPGELEVDPVTGETTTTIALLSALPAAEYAQRREGFESSLDWKSMKPKARRQLRHTLPDRLLDALRLDSADFQSAGWSRPPAARFVSYQRPMGAFAPHRARRSGAPGDASQPTTLRLVLAGRPLPRVEDAVRIGELVRTAALAKASGPDADTVPWTLSGHGVPADNRHGHAFYLPEANEHGRIEHVLVHASGGLGTVGLRAFDRLRRLYDGRGKEWAVRLEDFGGLDAFEHSDLAGRSRCWISVTPYLHPWFRKKGFEVGDQLKRECRQRGLPEPAAETLASVSVRGRDRRPVHFHRFRSRRGLPQPDTQGGFWRLTFPEPVDGPLALGFGCHFGLGMFRRHPDGSGED